MDAFNMEHLIFSLSLWKSIIFSVQFYLYPHLKSEAQSFITGANGMRSVWDRVYVHTVEFKNPTVNVFCFYKGGTLLTAATWGSATPWWPTPPTSSTGPRECRHHSRSTCRDCNRTQSSNYILFFRCNILKKTFRQEWLVLGHCLPTGTAKRVGNSIKTLAK